MDLTVFCMEIQRSECIPNPLMVTGVRKTTLTWAGGGCCTNPRGEGGACRTCWEMGGPEPEKLPVGSCWLGEAMT